MMVTATTPKSRDRRKETSVYRSLLRIAELVRNEHRWKMARRIRAGEYPGVDMLHDDCGVTLLSAYLRVMRNAEPPTRERILELLVRRIESYSWMDAGVVHAMPPTSLLECFNNHPMTNWVDVVNVVDRATVDFLA